jgi:hypothetical protein
LVAGLAGNAFFPIAKDRSEKLRGSPPVRKRKSGSIVSLCLNGYSGSNDIKMPTGSGGEMGASETVAVPVSINSQCEPLRELASAKCEIG